MKQFRFYKVKVVSLKNPAGGIIFHNWLFERLKPTLKTTFDMIFFSQCKYVTSFHADLLYLN